MRLSDYIRELGVPKFAKKFRVTERAATAYMYGARRPRPEVAERIVRESPVDWAGIYASEKRA